MQLHWKKNCWISSKNIKNLRQISFLQILYNKCNFKNDGDSFYMKFDMFHHYGSVFNRVRFNHVHNLSIFLELPFNATLAGISMLLPYSFLPHTHCQTVGYLWLFRVIYEYFRGFCSHTFDYFLNTNKIFFPNGLISCYATEYQNFPILSFIYS